MRSTLPSLTIAPSISSTRALPASAVAEQPPLPTIRLINATPSAAGTSSEASISIHNTFDTSFVSSPLAPRTDVDNAARRKKLVPKKSKLGLLGAVKSKDRSQNDFSDVVRRVGGTASAGRSGYEIYVDHTDDPDLEEIVLIKKKKSRLGLDTVAWGPMDEVTNTSQPPPANILKPKASENVLKPKGSTNILKLRSKGAENSLKPKGVENLLKPKADDKDKWWSISRGRKDSKEQKDSKRSKSPELSRARFNSLDSGILLTSPTTATQPHLPYAFGTNLSQTLLVPSAPHTQTFSPPVDSVNGHNSAALLAPPMEPQLSGSGSLAIRAMKSMRSMARIGSWAQVKNEDKEKEKVVMKEKTEAKKKKKKTEVVEKKKGTKEKKAKEKTIRLSGSSFEAGTATDFLPVKISEDVPGKDDETKSLGKKKQSILGLGLPSSMKFGTIRTISTSSSVENPQPATTIKRSSLNIFADRRPSSTISNSSSLRPPSTLSGISGKSSSGSNASIKWDEEGLENVNDMRRKDRERRRKQKVDSFGFEATVGVKQRDESRRSSEGRKRPLVSDIFPETRQQTRLASLESSSPPQSTISLKSAVINIEEATLDGHGWESETPIKRTRPRPVSEQILGRPMRPPAIYNDVDGALSILDAATNDLASLINRLDLEATPCTPDRSPIQRSSVSSLRYSASIRASGGNHESPISFSKSKRNDVDSPLRKAVAIRASAASINSLRPYSQAIHNNQQTKVLNRNEHLIGKQIVPLAELNWSVSPVKKAGPPVAMKRPTHRRTLSPPLPAADPPAVFQPLRPPKPKRTSTVSDSSELLTPNGFAFSLSPKTSTPVGHNQEPLVPSSSTFGDRPSKVSSVRKRSIGEEDNSLIHSPTPLPVFKTELRHSRTKSSLVSNKPVGMPIAPEAMKGLGMAGTMGSAVEPDIDPEDPDSDIPDELQILLSSTSINGEEVEETLSYRQPGSSTGLLPEAPLPEMASDAVRTVQQSREHYEEPQPVFRAQLYDEDANNADVEGSSDDDDTKKSFDFTGELKKLNESGASDRRSFVEQLENAFRTPARVDLKYDFLDAKDLNRQFLVPLAPSLPLGTAQDSSSSTMAAVTENDSLVEAQVPHDSPISDSEGYCGRLNISLNLEEESIQRQRSVSSNSSRPSDGQLNVSFKFGGGQLSPPTDDMPVSLPRTLSDIIPPPSHHSRNNSLSSCMSEDSSVLKSIFAQATNVLPCASEVAIPRPRPRLDSDSSSKRYPRQNYTLSQSADTSHSPNREDSRISFAGFDSFDEVRRGFEFGPDRPAFYPPPGAEPSRHHNKHDSVLSIASVSSYGSVIDHGNVDPFGYAHSSRPTSDDMSMSMSVDDTFSFIRRGPRTRVDSDASSFYFRSQPSMMGPIRRGHRIRDSMVSVTSNAPPVSLYNRSHGTHRRNDSSTSVSSIAYSYAMHGVNAGRASWARHSRNDPSLDSIMSDYSPMRLGRPGLGDKMLDSVFDHGMPLTAISASPTQSMDAKLNNPTSYDSIMDTRASLTRADSLFDNTGDKTSTSSDSVFLDNLQPARSNQGRRFRPISIISINSNHSPRKEDDTMISMLGGGHVRRKSIGSMIQHSPCAKVGKKRPSAPADKHVSIEEEISPNKARVTAKPSIVSTTSSKFGGERMIKARKGVLERQSLEASCLVAEGEDLASFALEPSSLRPGPAARSRSSTCTSASSGTETPPLSSDASSISGGSQSSIDMGHLNVILSNMTHPVTRPTRRARARGHGHRRRISDARASRTSVYETIQEENSTMMSPAPAPDSDAQSPISATNSVYIVDSEPTDTEWDDDRGIVAMRRYFALKDEAHDTVKESRRIWTDTPFSLFALQSFRPPEHPTGMQALLEHSQKNYGPLPSELRPRKVRSRTYSRPSPYPASIVKRSLSPEKPRPALEDVIMTSAPIQQPLQTKPTNTMTPGTALGSLNPISPFIVDFDKSKRDNTIGSRRPRVTSSARRNALGWTKRSTGKSSDLKENLGVGTLTTPSDSLRINRPRPRGRPTPGSVRSVAPPVPPLPQLPQLRIR